MRVNPTEKYCTWHLILEVSSWRGPQQDIIRTRNVRTPLLVCSTEKCPGPWKSLPEGRMQRPLSQKVFHRIFMLCSCYFHGIWMVFGWTFPFAGLLREQQEAEARKVAGPLTWRLADPIESPVVSMGF